jgi:hypothetical protein
MLANIRAIRRNTMRLARLLVMALFVGSLCAFPLVAAAQPAPPDAGARRHQKLDIKTIKTLRSEAAAKHQILEVIYYPDVDSVQNWDALYSTDDLAEVRFLPATKKVK